MTRLRVMPPLGCENDMRGRFTLWPFGDSHGTFYLSAGAVASYASAASSVSAARGALTGTGATPPVDALVMASAGAGFHRPRTGPGGSLPFQ